MLVAKKIYLMRKNNLTPTKADREIQACIENQISFSLVAGAGSGKTTSLVTALDFIRQEFGKDLLRNGQRIVCITYTNRAVDVIYSRLGKDNLFLVSTLHKFLWNLIKRFQTEVGEAIRKSVIPLQIERAQERDNGGRSRRARDARAKIERLQADFKSLESVQKFVYSDSKISRYNEGLLNHNDVIEVASYIVQEKPLFRKIIGFKYPYIFVDEAQDTFESIIKSLNAICSTEGLPIIGYFGDPMQQIYNHNLGPFYGPNGSKQITKAENYRCSKSVIRLLNQIRNDVTQIPGGENNKIEGSVELVLVQSEQPEGSRRRYSDKQLTRVTEVFDSVIAKWEWNDLQDVKVLFLARQMIARRLGFTKLNHLFTGDYASTNAQEKYEKGEHFLLKPFQNTICPIILAQEEEDSRKIIEILRRTSPAFSAQGVNKEKSLSDMINYSKKITDELQRLWSKNSLKEILQYCNKVGLCSYSERLNYHLNREPRTEEYNPEIHSIEKSDWLCDQFFSFDSTDLLAYYNFIEDNTPFSTQHGVKGEEYKNVIVVFDDIEAAWNIYSFAKTLSPTTLGDPTESQLERSRKLAYVCFSRAKENLRILLFTPNAKGTKKELLERGLFEGRQIDIYKE